jgi:hypothetical protein
MRKESALAPLTGKSEWISPGGAVRQLIDWSKKVVKLKKGQFID